MYFPIAMHIRSCLLIGFIDKINITTGYLPYVFHAVLLYR